MIEDRANVAAPAAAVYMIGRPVMPLKPPKPLPKFAPVQAGDSEAVTAPLLARTVAVTRVPSGRFQPKACPPAERAVVSLYPADRASSSSGNLLGPHPASLQRCRC